MFNINLQALLTFLDQDGSRGLNPAPVYITRAKTAQVPWRRHRFRSAAIAGAARLAVLGCSLGLLAGARAIAAPIDRYFRVQIVRICDNTGTVCAATPYFAAETTKIYAQAGIAPIFLPILNYNNSAVLNGTTGIDAISMAAFGCPSPCTPLSTTLFAFFANTLNGASYGNAWLNDNGSAFDASLIASFNGGIGRRDTFAHELGHNLGLDHYDVATNVMASGGVRAIPSSVADITPDGANLDQFTPAQIATIRGSRFLFANDGPTANVPAPLPLFGAAAGFGCSRRLRRRLVERS